MKTRVEEFFQEYDSGYVSIPWQWTKGVIDARNPPEILDTQILSQVSAKSNWVDVRASEIDTRTLSIAEVPQTSKADNISTAGAAFGGIVPGGYSAAFHQEWEVNVPNFWSTFTHDTVFITVDAVVSFTEASYKPDQRELNDWVWEFDAAHLLTAITPTYVSFRYIDRGVYRCVMKAVGYLLGGNHKIRFGFNFKTIWDSGQPQTTTWMSTVQLAAHVLTSAVTGRTVTEESSVESGPSNLTLVPDMDLNLLFSDDANVEPESPTEWALL